MKKYYFRISTILFLVLGLTSCSNEETKTQSQVVARPTVPLQNGEVRIGTQIWMTRNLNVSRYRNVDPIPHVTDPTEWIGLTTGAWCYYSNSNGNGIVYGKLYNGYAVMDPRGLAPVGWHIPNDMEWVALKTSLGTQSGIKMRSKIGWQTTTNYMGTNSSGFTALPGGRRTSVEGVTVFAGQYGYFWSTTAVSSPNSNANSYWLLGYNSLIISQLNNSLAAGKSVRCLKD
jgi:uncharacterized protein (TIGR02145 family)